MQNPSQAKPKYAIVATVQLPNFSDVEFETSLAELRDLAKTLGFQITATFMQKRSSLDATAFRLILDSNQRRQLKFL